MDKKFLLRMTGDRFREITEIAGEISLNQYINNLIDEHIIQVKGGKSNMEKIDIYELKVRDVREAVTVTQRKWFMDILLKYHIHFFAPSRIVTPMINILFYGDSSCTPANCISHIGKVSHIYRYVKGDEIKALPELQSLLNDPKFANEILSWAEYQIVVLSEVEALASPIPLTKNYVNHPRIIVNRTTTMAKTFAAKKIDDLF